MSDLINRADAIDAVCMEWCGVKHQDCIHPFDAEKDDYYWCNGCETVLQTLPDLPSAELEPCEDAVSRKAVEEMLKNGFPARGMWEIEGDVIKQTVCETLADALMDLEKLPSAEPERKTGKWIYHPETKNIYGGKCIECSECGEKYMVMYVEDEKYCRNCGSHNGARMEVQE